MKKRGRTGFFIALVGMMLLSLGCNTELNQAQGKYTGSGDGRWYFVDENCEITGTGDGYEDWDIELNVMQINTTVTGTLLASPEWNPDWILPFIATNNSGHITAELGFDIDENTGYSCKVSLEGIDYDQDLISDVLTFVKEGGDFYCIRYDQGSCVEKLIISARELTRATE